MSLERELLARFVAILPPGWKVTVSRQVSKGFDSLYRVGSPDGSEIRLAIETKRALAPRDVPRVVAKMREAARRFRSPVALVVAAPYLSELARAALEGEGFGFIDATGNVLIRCDRPGLFIRSTGASRDPSPSDDMLQSLGGRGAARAVRALVDFRPPFGIRDLASRAGVPLGTLSRTVDVLDRDGLIERAERGPIERVDVRGVIRRWAKDYSIVKSNRVVSALSTRGLPSLKQQLATRASAYAATGAFAASQFAPVAPTRLAALYVSDPEDFAVRMDLRLVDAGANVWLIEPASDVVFDRVTRRGDLVCVSAPQLAVDLLTGPGRDPSEGEEFLTWMEKNDNAWRA